MLFGNPNSVTITKKILGVQYICPPGEFVEIPDRVAYVIKTEGTLLVPADELTKAQPKRVEVASAPAEPAAVTATEQPAPVAAEPVKQPQQSRQDTRSVNRR